MKTKLIHLPGAAIALLVTFGFTCNPAALARILIVGMASLVTAPCQAAPPGGGGNTGGGTIYYVGPFNGTQAATSVITTMKSDGSNKTELGRAMFGNPSTVLYNGYRWFISYKVIVPNASTWLYGGPHFSPRSSHIVYTGFHQTTGQFDVFRATAKGATRVNLTNTSSPGVNEYSYPNPGAGWR